MTVAEIQVRFGLSSDSGEQGSQGQGHSQGQGQSDNGESGLSAAMAQVWQTISQRMQVDLETLGKQRGLLPGSLTQNLAAMNREKYDENKSNLPSDLAEIVIEGGCHAYFGMYGAQNGDGVPTISNHKQIRMTADAVADLIYQ
jgi:hypothetical protein